MDRSATTSSSDLSAGLSSGKHVLVVEDETRIRNMLSQALKQMGFEPMLAPSAEAGKRALATQVYDILILDLNLPGMSGMEFLELVRKTYGDIQVIILTGFGDLEAARKAIHLDVVEFLTKPCTLGSLEVALARATSRRKGQIVSEAAANPEPVMQFEESPRRGSMPTGTNGAGVTDVRSASNIMEEMEQVTILNVLQKNNGNRAATARELGISLRKLYYRLGEYHRKGLLS